MFSYERSEDVKCPKGRNRTVASRYLIIVACKCKMMQSDLYPRFRRKLSVEPSQNSDDGGTKPGLSLQRFEGGTACLFHSTLAYEAGARDFRFRDREAVCIVD